MLNHPPSRPHRHGGRIWKPPPFRHAPQVGYFLKRGNLCLEDWLLCSSPSLSLYAAAGYPLTRETRVVRVRVSCNQPSVVWSRPSEWKSSMGFNIPTKKPANDGSNFTLMCTPSMGLRCNRKKYSSFSCLLQWYFHLDAVTKLPNLQHVLFALPLPKKCPISIVFQAHLLKLFSWCELIIWEWSLTWSVNKSCKFFKFNILFFA